MSSSTTLPLPAAKRVPQKVWGVLALIVLLLCILALILFYVFHRPDGISSVYAQADGLVYTLAPDMSARLLDVTVQEGADVQKGQVLGHLDVSEYEKNFREAQKDVSGLRPPDMQEIAARLKDAETAEADASSRLASARHEEEAKQKYMEDCVVEHVRAELRLRSLANQSPRDPAYQQARAHEMKMREKMNRAKEEFEFVSGKRAALGQELQRVRYEIQEAKRIASSTRYSALLRGQQKAPQRPAPVNGDLVAPVTGTVINVSARAGQMVEKGDPVLLILPKSREKDALWVDAWFDMEKQTKIRAGMSCEVRRLGGSGSLRGVLESIRNPEPLPRESRRDAELAQKTGLFLPVRVQIPDPQGLRPGDRILCTLDVQ